MAEGSQDGWSSIGFIEMLAVFISETSVVLSKTLMLQHVSDY